MVQEYHTVNRAVKWLPVVGAAVLIPGALFGCGVLPGTTGSSSTLFSVLLPVTDLSTTSRASGPFGQMLHVDVPMNQTGRVPGSLSGPEAMGVYDIGPVRIGDQIKLSVDGVTRGFDPAVGVFDADQNCMWLNDDRSYYGGKWNAYADFVSRRDTDHCYVVVSASPKSDTAGDFDLEITVRPDRSIEPPSRQVVYLDFEGASQVQIGQRSPVDIPRFDGGLIGPEFANDTDVLVELTVARVRQDFAGFEVQVVSSRESPPPASDHTTVFMGSFNPGLLGIADNVDAYNQRMKQEAIVFVDTFEAFLVLEPSIEEMVDALANVTSHEIGHLLGLQHTQDPLGIMDTSASLRQMMLPQSFRKSELHPFTFLTGSQHAPMSLLESVGGSRDVAALARLQKESIVRDPWYDQGPRIPARSSCVFGTGCWNSHLSGPN